MVVQCSLSSSVSEAVKKALIQSSSLTWKSAILSNMVIFVLGLPILLSGLSLSGIASAFLLGTLTWRAFGPSAFLLVATYFIIVERCFLNAIQVLEDKMNIMMRRLLEERMILLP
nr:protein vte6, chloroplastic [Quercus suber]